MAESEQFGGPNPVGKVPEKSNFSQACSLLSQYLKGQRSLADLGLGMPKENQEAFRPSVTTMNLLTHMESPSENGNQNAVVEPPGVKPAGLFPQFGGFGPSGSVEDVNKAEFRKSTTVEPETSQMTIFYAGQVLVFNDFPADKAKEILALAGKTTSNVSAAVFVPPTTSIPPPPPPPPLCMDKAEPRKPLAPPEPSPVAIPEKSSNHDQSPQRRPEANDSELPIARRASLHRFLEKRKDRVAAKAPYQVNHRAIAAPPKPEEGQNSNQLDLKL